MKLFYFVFGFVLLFGCTQQPLQPEPKYHVHADFKVYLDGSQFDFNKVQFMSTPYKPLNEYVHLHDFNPNVIHFHKEGVALGEFFESLGMKFDENCFDTNEMQYCNLGEKKLYFFVNGQANQEFGDYIPNDLDKILIFYGQEALPQEMFNSVTNEACIYSEKCPVPPGVVLPPENCSSTQPCMLPT